MNRLLTDEELDAFKHLLRQRDFARTHLWNDLHSDWLPAYDEDPAFLPRFQKLLERALRHPKLDALLNRTSKIAFGAEAPLAAGVLSAAAAREGVLR